MFVNHSNTVRELVAFASNEVSIFEEQSRSVAANEVRVRSLFSLVSQGTERITLQGLGASFRKSWDKNLRLFVDDSKGIKRFPVSLGYSCVGRIAEIGTHVTRVKQGDIVWLDRPHKSEHVVDENEALWGLCQDNVDPRRYTFRVLAKVALAGVHDARPYLGATAAVVGLGVVGLLTVNLLKLAGATRIYGVDPSDERRALAASFGAIPVDPTGGDAAAIVKVQEEKKGVDCAIETSGAYGGLQTAIRCVSVGGRVVTVSTYPGGAGAIALGEEYHRNRVELLSSMSVNECPHRGAPLWDIQRLLVTTKGLLDTGALEPERLVTRTVPFAEMPHFYQELGNNLADIATIIEY